MNNWMSKPKCLCEDYNLTQSSSVYIKMDLDNVSGFEDGVAFVERKVKYCPCCGKELPKGDDFE